MLPYELSQTGEFCPHFADCHDCSVVCPVCRRPCKEHSFVMLQPMIMCPTSAVQQTIEEVRAWPSP